MARIQARAAAMQLVYEHLEGGSGEGTLTELIGFTPETAGGEATYEEDKQLIDRLVSGVEERVNELDSEIASCLHNWTLDRIARVDLCILRVAVWSLRYERETPASIIIKEAVDMAGHYSTEKSGAFVNGVLSACLKAARGEDAE